MFVVFAKLYRRSARSRQTARKAALRIESLEGRALPGGAYGGVLAPTMNTGDYAPSQVRYDYAKMNPHARDNHDPGLFLGSKAGATGEGWASPLRGPLLAHIGEEIPQ